MTYEQIKQQLPEEVKKQDYDRVKNCFGKIGLPLVSISNDKIFFHDKFQHGYIYPLTGIAPMAERFKAAGY